MSVCMYVCIYMYVQKIRQHMNGVAIVICVNITMSCLYQIVPYMCSMYPLSVDNKKKKKSSNSKSQSSNRCLSLAGHGINQPG